MKKNTVFFAWALIITGSALLLHELNLIEFGRSFIVIAGSLFLGVVFFKKGLIHPEHKGIFGGTFWILNGVMFLLMTRGILPMEDTFGIAAVCLNLAVSNLIYYAFNRQQLSNITWAIVFSVFGAAFLSIYYDLISAWRVADLFSIYWPVLLIIAGFILLIEGFLKKQRH